MILLGIDPGDRWCGFVGMRLSKSFVQVESRTYDRSPRSLLQTVETLLPFAGAEERVIVAAENFQHRNVGHQRFNAGNTLRLLGALEYLCQRAGWSWNLIAPGDWTKELHYIFGEQFVADYRQHWPDRSRSQWDHCLSAWRVLGRYLMAERLITLDAFRQGADWQRCSPWLSRVQRDEDLVAPAMIHTFDDVTRETLKSRSPKRGR